MTRKRKHFDRSIPGLLRAAAGTAAAGVLMLLAVPASALTIDVVGGSRGQHDSARVELIIRSSAGRSVDQLRLLPSTGELEGCDRADQVLGSGTPVACGWQLPTGTGRASLGAWVRYSDGEIEQHRIDWTQARGGTFPQAVLALVSSGIHNDSDLDGVLDAGESIDYTYRLINLGILALESLAVVDIDGAVACPATTLAVGADQVCSSSHVITADEEAAGLVENVVEATGFDALGLPVQSSDQIIRASLGGRAGIAVLKSPFLADDVDGSGFANLGDIVRYDFVVTNTNDEPLSAVELIEPDPTLIDTPIVCNGTTFEGNAYSGNGTGTLAVGDAVLCTATYEIRQSDVDNGQALNLVQASGTTPLGLTVNGTGATSLVLSGPGALTVEKSVVPSVAQIGDTVVYTITVENAGPVTLFDVQILDPLPVGIQSFAWACAGAYCPNAAGSGAINELIPAFPGGEAVTYTIEAVVGIDAPTDIPNVVTVFPPGLVECLPAGTPTPCEAEAGIQVGEPIGVPALSREALLLLMLAVALVAIRARR